MHTTRLSMTVHSYFDPACYFYPIHGNGIRIPMWVRRLFGWNCDACRSCEGHTHSTFKPCVNGLYIDQYLTRHSMR